MNSLAILGVAGTGVFGLLIGSFLNVVIWRVPRGESLVPSSHCPHCDAAIRPWQNVPVISWLALGGRCAGCRGKISARYPLVELGTGVAFALVAAWLVWATGFPTGSGAEIASWWLALAALLWFAGAGIALAAIDLEHRRLPDAIVLPSLGVVTVLLAASAALAGDWLRLGQTLGGGAALFAGYLLIAIVYPAGMGGGDVKLAPLVGVVLGWVGWSAVVVGAFAGFLLGALWGVALMLLRRGGRKTALPFGPFMLLGAWIGIVGGGAVASWYLRLVGLG